jgi:glycosyltransferase involved in cell wall biosynthesis
MRACFNALRSEPSLDVRLFKGAGASGGPERALPHLHRNGVAARALGALTRRGPYVVEQATFTTQLIPHVMREQPDVVFFCDPAVGKILAHWRRLQGGSFRLLFQNSGPIEPPFPLFDHIQQVTPTGFETAVAAGESPGRQTLLPLALDIGPAPAAVSTQERVRRRLALHLPTTRPVVLSVGALNRRFKRMDYLIREVAAMPEPRPHLVMLGQEEDDTPAVRVTAELLLGENFTMRSVDPEDVADYYRAADAFVLASLREGFGLVYAEALAHGLPCIAHDYPVARYVLGEQGIFADLRERGALAHALGRALQAAGGEADAHKRHRAMSNRFGWEQLAPQYTAMLRRCAADASRLEAAS